MTARRRGLLVFNPEATSVSPRVRDVIAHALSAEMTLEIAQTKRREHATHLARGATHEGFDLVVVLGGDGTVNEVINGLAGTGLPVAPLPGGSTNVFARTMGLPDDPIEATSIVLERLAEGSPPREINLGRVNGRAFGFCAGVGLDAAVVRAVERRAKIKKTVGQPFFIVQALRTYFFAYPKRDAPMRIELLDRTIDGVYEAIVCNSDPYTFLGARPFRLAPQADPTHGLEVTALTSLSVPTIARVVGGAFARGRHLRSRRVRALHDLPALRILSEWPVPYQVDGEFVGESAEFHFESVPRALRVIA